MEKGAMEEEAVGSRVLAKGVEVEGELGLEALEQE